MKTNILLLGTLFLISSTVFSQVSTVGLVAYYPFNGNTNDESITANHATVYGSTLTTDRNNISGKAYSFNGSSDRLQAAKNDVYDFGNGDFSITSWVSLNAITTSRIVSAGYDSDDGIWGLGFGSHPKWGTGLRINYFVYSGGDYHDFSSNEITGYSLGNWAFVGVTKTGNTLTFYFNGQQVGTATIPYVSNANSYLSIGSRQLTSGSHIEFINGKIDEVRIYKRGLSEAEIIEGYNSTRNSLVAYYPFNGNANDESGNGNNGTVHGALLSSDRFGISGRAYSFNGSTDYIDIGNDPSLKMTEKLSISVWVKPDVFPLSSYHNIISDHGDGNNNTKVLRFYKNAIEFLLGPEGSTEARYVFPNSIANQWQHITATYDGSFMRLFVNGSIVDSVSRTGTITANPLSLLIAKSHFNEFLPGSIDDIKIYNRPLSITEIKQEYDSTRNPLVAYYPFNGNANDESGNGHDGTINGNTTLTTDRFVTKNKAFTFPDQSSSISLNNTTALNLESGFTINAWVKYKNAHAVIVCKHVCGFANGFFFGIDTDGQIQLWLANSGWSTVRTNATFIENKWYMLTATFDANTEIAKVFVNGELGGTGSVTYNNFSSNPISIGESYHNNCGPGNLSGAIDEVKIYDRPLSEAEISQEYNLSRSSLIAYYPFNGNANDESGNGNHGTITGALVTPAVDRYGEEGKAYKFWFPDYVSVPTNTSFFTDEFTVSYWYKVASYWGERGVMSCVGNKGGYQQYFTGTTFSYIIGYNFPLFAHLYSNYNVPDITNTWHHVVLAYKKTGDNLSFTKLFINGELMKTENHSLAIAYPGGDIFYIGTNHGGLNFNGELDDIRFYNRMLSDAEIMSLHTSELPNAVNNQFISNISISPNPTDGHFVVDLGSTYQNIKINICDITGRTIKEEEYSNVQRLNQMIEAPSGIYFINIISENEKSTFKLIKK